MTFIKKTAHLIFLCTLVFQVSAQQTIIKYLSGTDKDHTVKWDFKCTAGRNSNVWSKIPVPSCWETQGFGTYNYYEDKINPDEQGFYKHSFQLLPAYKGKKIMLVFDGAMTDTKVLVNGQEAGPVHQGGFYQFKFDITSLVTFNSPNLLEIAVSKRSSNNSVNRAERQADFWMFGGIFRPVYLEVLPPDFIERVAIDARADGNFNMQVFSNAKPGQTLQAQVFDTKGVPVDKPFTLVPGDSMLRHHFGNVQLWNAEQPSLYKVVVSLKQGNKILHTISQKFGFRTAELREQDGFYVNGKKVIFKGVCRHSEWPETGRTLSRDVHLLDIAAIKGMNMNAVRMSHYPPDKEFLDLCDSLGLFVLDELTGWQKAYDTIVGRRLVKELVVRDVNHPSVVIWDNGNEGGWNRALDGDYDLYDPQKRHVIHPWERFNGTNTKHYPDYAYVKKEVANGKEVFFPTEFMHGLFDGGHGAALEDFWNEMLKHPHLGGGFLWALHDEGLVRNDRHDSIDVAGNQAPDGIVGPHREKEGSYYTIREIWSPVYIETKKLDADFDGSIKVENRYIYNSFDKVKFEWRLVNFPGADDKQTSAKLLLSGSAVLKGIMPGKTAVINIPAALNVNADALYLYALGAKGDTICNWSWALPNASKKKFNISNSGGAAIQHQEDDHSLTVVSNGISFYFNKTTGFLQKVVNAKSSISLSGGPALAGSPQVLKQFKSYQQGENFIVEPIYAGDSLTVQWIFNKTALPKLVYAILPRDTADYTGITFNYPEQNIKGMKWLGLGPYRVWKNRLRGEHLGVWQKDYNNTITGESWLYPEFKGWHAALHWVKIQNSEHDFTIYSGQPDLYLQMLQPQKPKGAGNNNTSPAFADGSIGIMHSISPIGTKFQKADVMGPQSQKNISAPGSVFRGVLYLDFR